MRTYHKNQPTNPSSIKTRFTIRFLQTLKKLNKPESPNPPTMAERQKRFHIIRASAYASMASAVGPKRAWSRAVLWKIRNRTLHRTLMKKSRTQYYRKRFVKKGNPNSEKENDLRELVPGGEGMDFCKLLCETAHYIKCLRTKIEVMNNIVDHYSN